MDLTSRPVTRRTLLRGSVLGGAGLAGAYLLGCGDGGDEPGTTPVPTGAAEPTVRPPQGTTGETLTWEQIAVSGSLPPPRRHHSLVLTDPGDLLLFGGQGEAGDLADLWRFDVAGGAWTEMAPAGPVARHGHNAEWDYINGRMLVFGGQQGSSFFNDTWQYDPVADAWAELAPAGPVPAARYGAASAFSAMDSGDTSEPYLPGLFLVTHGFTASGRFDDTWTLDPTTDSWSEVIPIDEGVPLARCLIRGVWDTLRNRLMIFSGQSNEEPFIDDLWTLSSSRGWTDVLREPRPTARTFYSFEFDTVRQQAILLGGNSANGVLGDLWQFHVQDEFWTQDEAQGTPPGARLGHDAAFNNETSTLFVFGGNDGSADLNDLWALRIEG